MATNMMSFGKGLSNIHDKLTDITNTTQNITDTLTNKVNQFEEADLSLSQEIQRQNEKCQSIIRDLYEAKLAILEDERTALNLSKELHSYRIYQRLIAKLPWYKRIFKFQTKKLKDEVGELVGKEFDEVLTNVENEITSFTYESYCKQFEENVEAKGREREEKARLEAELAEQQMKEELNNSSKASENLEKVPE